MLKRVIMVLAALVAGVSMPIVVAAQPPAGEPTSFRFELEEARSHRGRGVEGYVYNELPWRITNVRVRVDSIDGNGTVTSSASGWVIGDVRAGGRAYFYVPVSSAGTAYRASVVSFDKVLLETPRLESP
jgi:hypothetical protein